MGYAYLIVISLGFLTGCEDHYNLGVTSRYISAVNTYVIQCLGDDLVMPSNFMKRKVAYRGYRGMVLTVATLYEG